MAGGILEGVMGLFWDALVFARKDRNRTISILIGLVAILAFMMGMFSQFVFVLIIASELILAFFVGEFELKKLGIEMVTLIAVLSGVVFGPTVGLVIGAAMSALHLVLSRALGPYVIYCIPAAAFIGFLAGYAPFSSVFGSNIVLMGITLSLIYNIITSGLGILISGNIFGDMLWSLSNLAVNYALFFAIAPTVIRIAGF
jgi:hypothetical protein